MKYIKTFENYSVNEEEGLLTKFIQGGKNFTLDGKEVEKLLADEDISPEFSMKDGKAAGTKRAMNLLTSLKQGFKLDDKQALEAAMKIIKWNGYVNIDMKESKWNPDKKELSIVVSKGTANTKVF